MALSHILDYIAKKSSDSLSVLLDSAKSDAAEIVSAAKSRANDKIKSLQSQAEEDQRLLKRRSDSSVNTFEKSEELKLRDIRIAEVFAAVESSIVSGGEDLQVEIFTNLLSSFDFESGEVLCDQKYISSVEKALKNIGKNFTVSAKDGVEGIVYNGDAFSVDFTFNTIIERVIKPQHEARISQILFS